MLDYGRQYREYAKEKTLENQKLILKGKEAVFKKSKDIDGGKGVWNSGSLRNINLALDDVLIPFFSQKPYNKKPIHSINRTDIAEFKNWREGLETIRNKPYSPSTINKQNTVLRSIFQFAQYKIAAAASGAGFRQTLVRQRLNAKAREVCQING